MNVKKIIAGAAILLALTSSVFAAKAKKSDKKTDKLKVVTTIFPEYDWTREILGDNAKNVELTLLLGNGVDLHSYQPSIQDIAKISTADIFIYVGGESDGWVKDAFKNAKNKNMKVINLLETLGDKVKAEEVKEGIQAEEEEDDEHEHHHDGDHDHEAEEHHHHHDDEDEVEYDEHVWLSLRNAKIFSAEITAALCEKDAANAAAYKANLASYTARLDALDAKYAAAVKAGSKKTILFGDRFPFRYLVDDYGLDYFAAFVGCSAETEASFETVIFLAKKADELGLNTVLKIESGDGKIARTIVQNTKKKNARVLTMDSIQSTTAKQAAAGTTYLKIMEENLTVLVEALK
ncbi:metal ABC transporter substrate-binding protein [Treponema bryantii]|uniref:metal ABC transporter substrate-binding protein n=1 Tax=Treponema bryantii TaxID=163 RepID=UPI0003B50215|nr:metal ABC transporter substrate-binding protein [Treponema bryantii]